MIVKQVQTDRFSYLGISQVGESHVERIKQNQDAFEFFVLNDSFVIAVSDGLGSCEQSHIGSQTAVLICSFILLEISDDRLDFNPESLTQRFTVLWTGAFPPNMSCTYSSTLKAVFVKGNELIAISIGDGLLVVLSGEEMILAPTAEGNFINETDCLSYAMRPDVFWTRSIPKKDNTVIFLSTDGVSNGILQGRESEMVREIAVMKDVSRLRHEIENMLNEMSKYNSDDKTVGVVKL
jgi:serine/threonine protein phosphatase PrpC